MHFWRWFPFFARWDMWSFPGEQLWESALLLYLHGDNMETTLPKGNPRNRRLIHCKELKVEFLERGFFCERLKTIQNMKERVPPKRNHGISKLVVFDIPYMSLYTSKPLLRLDAHKSHSPTRGDVRWCQWFWCRLNGLCDIGFGQGYRVVRSHLPGSGGAPKKERIIF